MIDRTLVVKLSLAAALFVLAGAIVAAAAHSVSLGGGIALGAALGAAPFLSWAWILKASRNRALAALLLVAKISIYSGALYLGVTRGFVAPFGVFLGITGVLVVVFAGAWIRLSQPKEVAP